MEEVEKDNQENSDITPTERLQGIVKLAALLVIIFAIWYGFNLAEGI
jgi:hypothetical protein